MGFVMELAQLKSAGELLDELATSKDAFASARASGLIATLPEALLVIHQQDIKEHEQSGCQCACFIAPSTKELVGISNRVSKAEELPTFYSLRDIAAPLTNAGLGAMLFRSDTSQIAMTFSCGDLLQLRLEGTLGPSQSANQWARQYLTNDKSPEPCSAFLRLNDAESDETIPFELLPVPETIIPSDFRPFLEGLLKAELPGIEFPVLARNQRHELALIFFANSKEDIQSCQKNIPLVAWFLPRHYHLLFLPTQ